MSADDVPDAGATPPVPELSRDLADARPGGRDIDDQHRFARLHERLFGLSAEPVRWGRFVLLDRLGQGGMGVVYSAYDPELDRKVALKLLRSTAGTTDSARERLRREAQALARLSHPNVILVHDVLIVDRQLALVMEFVSGQTVRAWLQQAPRSVDQVLNVYLAAARGLAAAHEAGIVHRDFKPDNTLIGHDGRIRVADFGLARAYGDMPGAGDDETRVSAPVPASVLASPLTVTGAFLGTPVYTAPERMDASAVDDPTRAAQAGDQFSLCVALYEGLYSVRPFAGETWSELLDNMRAGRIVPPPVNSDVPAWLHAVVVRGLAPRPEQRWPSMNALIAALRANPAARRKRRLRVAALFALILAGILAGGWGIQRANRMAAIEREQKQAARAERDSAHAQLEQQVLLLQDTVRMLALRTLERDPTKALAILRDVEDTASTPEWHERAAVALRWPVARDILEGHEHAIIAMVVSPDERYVATASRDKTLRVWPLDSRAPPLVLAGHDDRLTALAVSPDSQVIVTGSKDTTVRVWRADGTGTAVVLRGHSAEIDSLAFSPDGKILASASADQSVRLWNLADRRARALLGHTGTVRSVAFSPDGNWLASASADHTARLFPVGDGPRGRAMTLAGHTAAIRVAIFSPDSSRLLTLSADRTARLWSLTAANEYRELQGHTGRLLAAAFSPDGRHVAATSDDHTVHVWDLAGNRPAKALTGHSSNIYTVVFSPDSRRVAAGATDGDIRIWDVSGSEAPIELRGHDNLVSGIAFARNGKNLLSASWDGAVRIWPVPRYPHEVVLRGHEAAVVWVSLSPDGAAAVTASFDHTARVWSLDDHTREPIVLRGHRAQVTTARFSPDGDRVVTTSFDGTARVWHLSGGRLPVILEGHTNVVQSAVFSPDGTHVATASRDATARIWNADGTGVPISLEGHQDRLFHIEFSADGKRVLTVADDHSARIWDANTGRGVPIEPPAGVRTAAFSPRGDRVITTGLDHMVRILRISDEQPPTVVTRFQDDAHYARFSPDESRVLTCSPDTSVRIWNSDGTGPLMVLRGHRDAVPEAAFDATGTHVLTFSRDDTVRVWNLERGGHPTVLVGHTADVMTAVFRPDRLQAISVSLDGSVRIWNDVAPESDLEGALWRTTDYCTPPERQQILLGFQPAVALRSYERCRRRIDRLPGNRLR